MPHLSTSADARIFEILKRGLVFQVHTTKKNSSNLVVGLPFDPIACWQATEEIFSCLIIAENKDWEGQGRNPPPEFQWVHTETLVHTWKN